MHFDASTTARRALHVLIEGYHNRRGRRFFYRNGEQCGKEYVSPLARTPEQKHQDEQLFYEIHSFVQTVYWAGKSNEEAQQIMQDFKRRRELLPDEIRK